MGEDETEINFVLVGKSNEKYLRGKSNPLGVAISAGGNRHGQKKLKKVLKNE